MSVRLITKPQKLYGAVLDVQLECQCSDEGEDVRLCSALGRNHKNKERSEPDPASDLDPCSNRTRSSIATYGVLRKSAI